MQVSEEIVARPAGGQLIAITGQNNAQGPSYNKPCMVKILPFKVDPKAYIHGKSNRNVLITGSGGQRKSKLTHHLLSRMKCQKTIFSFKPGEEYLKAGYGILGYTGEFDATEKAPRICRSADCCNMYKQKRGTLYCRPRF